MYIHICMCVHIYMYKSKVAGVAVGGRDLDCERIPLAAGRHGV